MTGLNRFLAATFLTAFSVGAHAVDTTYVFDSVSKIALQSSAGRIFITGTLVNETTPTTLEAPFGNARCEAFFNMMLESAGAYNLSITINVIPANPPQDQILLLNGCSLERKP